MAASFAQTYPEFACTEAWRQPSIAARRRYIVNGTMPINCTPHTVNVGEFSILPEPTTARVSVVTHDTGIAIFGIPVVEEQYGDVVGLPDPEDGVVYIVSRMVADALPERSDLVVPTGLLRDTSGAVIGATAWLRPTHKESLQSLANRVYTAVSHQDTDSACLAYDTILARR